MTLNYQSQNIIIIFLGGGLFCFLIVKLFILHTNSTSRLQSSYLLILIILVTILLYVYRSEDAY